MQKELGICIGFSFMFLLVIIPSYAQDYSSYLTLVDNSEQCLVDCWAIFKIHNLPVSITIDQKSKFALWYNKAGGALNLQELKFQRLNNVSYQVKVYEYTCDAIDPTCSPSGFHYETRYKNEWLDFNPLGKTIQAGTDYYIKISAKRNARLGANDVDWKIRFVDYEPPWAWWNSSWSRKKLINVSTTADLTNYQIGMNVTYDSDMLANFSDLRFVNASENDELDYYIESKSDSNWAYVWVKGNWSNANGTQMYMYYGNSGADTTSNKTNTFILYSDKDDIDNWVNGTDGLIMVDNDKLYFNETEIGGTDLAYRPSITTPSVYEIYYIYNVTEIVATEAFAVLVADGGLSDRMVQIGTPHSPDPTKFKFYEGDWKVACSGFSFNTTFKGKIIINETASDIDYYFLDENDSEICSNLSRSYALGSPTDGDELYAGDGGGASTTETYVDYFRIRKYTEPEPTSAFGSEEGIGGGGNHSYTVDYNAQVGEGTQETFLLSVEFDNSTITEIKNGTLWWNASDYFYNSTSTLGNTTNFTRYLDIPAIDTSNVTVNFYWNFTLVYANGTNITDVTSTYQQEIFKKYLTNCSWLSNVTTLIFTVWDEENTSASLNASLDITFEVIGGSNYSFEYAANHTHSVCIFPTDDTIQVHMHAQYEDTGYYPRSYFFYNATLTNQSTNISLYLIDNSTGARILYTVVDSAGDEQEGVIIKTLRYYVGTNTYQTVGMMKTDSEGKSIGYWVPYDVWYKYLLEKDGVLLDTKDASQIAENEITLTIDPSTIIEWFKYYGSIAYNCSFDNSTEYIKCTVTDTSGSTMTQACIEVREIFPLNTTLICSQCGNAPSTTIGCHVGNVTGRAFVYSLNASLNFNPLRMIVLEQEILDWLEGARAIVGLEGTLLVFLLIGTLGFIGLWHPEVSIILILFTLGATFWLGLLDTSLLGLGSMLLAGGIMVFVIRR